MKKNNYSSDADAGGLMDSHSSIKRVSDCSGFFFRSSYFWVVFMRVEWVSSASDAGRLRSTGWSPRTPLSMIGTSRNPADV